MSSQSQQRMALLVDDEPEYLDWVREYLEMGGLVVEIATTLRAGFDALEGKQYTLVLVDMNIPSHDALTTSMVGRTPIASKYPGLALAQRCRDKGYGAHAVIAYTVHDDDRLAVELDALHCRYVLKGRPEVMKRVLASSLAPAGR